MIAWQSDRDQSVNVSNLSDQKLFVSYKFFNSIRAILIIGSCYHPHEDSTLWNSKDNIQIELQEMRCLSKIEAIIGKYRQIYFLGAQNPTIIKTRMTRMRPNSKLLKWARLFNK